MSCEATNHDCGHSHHNRCYCREDQGSGYTYSDEYGECDFCKGLFETGQLICFDDNNESRLCPDIKEFEELKAQALKELEEKK